MMKPNGGFIYLTISCIHPLPGKLPAAQKQETQCQLSVQPGQVEEGAQTAQSSHQVTAEMSQRK